jgi:hypothetical protein
MLSLTLASDPTAGIPMLDFEMQATGLVAPVVKWGVTARSQPMRGTYHFYTADYKFRALAKSPAKLLITRCVVAVEPNFSTQPGDDLSRVLEAIHRKRSMARYWQSQGVRIVVDLNVEPEFRHYNLIGVPPGWGAYAVRTQHGIGWDVIEADHELAAKRCGGVPPLFAVFGGGKSARAYCVSRGWVHVPEHRHVIEGREVAYG